MSISPLLKRSAFLSVVRHAPLVAIDLLVRDADGHMLVGHRTNPPARGYWFVPGGRIRKGETLVVAFDRISAAELGHSYSIGEAHFVGVYEHFYAEDFTGEVGHGAHYIVLGYMLDVDRNSLQLPTDQHDGYRWVDPAEGLRDETIHANTHVYFRSTCGHSRELDTLVELLG